MADPQPVSRPLTRKEQRESFLFMAAVTVLLGLIGWVLAVRFMVSRHR